MFDPTYTDEWKRALEDGDSSVLREMIDTEYPGTVLFHLTVFLMKMNTRLRSEISKDESDRLQENIDDILSIRNQIRSFYDWNERKRFDIETLGELYRGRAVIPFLGAGVSMDAGGPSWPKLVEGLLLTALEPERQKKVPVPKKGGGWYLTESDTVVQFDPQQEKDAYKALDEIKNGCTDIDLLMAAAQMCADLFKENFFSWVTPLLYMNCPVPGPIHFVLSELSLGVHNANPGWAGIVTYNFDNLMGEMLDKQGRAYSVLTVKNGEGIVEVASDVEANTEIIHVHGFVPRELMRIDGIQYVFSADQYKKLYGGRKSALLNTIRMLLEKPDLYALYIGCSFTDTAMNNMISKAFTKRPGDYHYALIRLPEAFVDSLDIPEDQLMTEEKKFLEMGIQPIWFRNFNEVPELISRLA